MILFGVNKLDLDLGGLYNSMIIVNNEFSVIQSYNKRKLVPFGEFYLLKIFLITLVLKKLLKDMGRF